MTFSVTFDDPESVYAADYAALEQGVLAAGAAWSQYLDADVSLEVEIAFSSSVPTANGGSSTYVYLRTESGINIFQDGAASEIMTGNDANGSQPDIVITLGTGFLADTLWIDPTPFDDLEAVPFDRVDAVTVLTHELGHGLGLNGYSSGTNGSLPGDYQSTFDQFVSFTDGNIYFDGPTAVAVYGGPVPLTFGNNFHVGNEFPRPGSDLLEDVMNGVQSLRGRRLLPSTVDLAILKDLGLPLLVDVTENLAPVIEDQDFTVYERSPVNTVVGTVAATDPNFRQRLQYAIINGNSDGAFQINSSTGVISVADRSVLNFGPNSTYALTVEVTDNGIPALSASATITVDVLEMPIPQIATSTGAANRGKGPKVVVDPQVQLLQAAHVSVLSGARLTIAVQTGGSAKDKLVVVNGGDRWSRLTLVRGQLKRGKDLIARVSGGVNGSPLEFTFQPAANISDVELVMRRIALQTRRKDPGTRTIAFQLILNDGGTSNLATKQVVAG